MLLMNHDVQRSSVQAAYRFAPHYEPFARTDLRQLAPCDLQLAT